MFESKQVHIFLIKKEHVLFVFFNSSVSFCLSNLLVYKVFDILTKFFLRFYNEQLCKLSRCINVRRYAHVQGESATIIWPNLIKFYGCVVFTHTFTVVKPFVAKIRHSRENDENISSMYYRYRGTSVKLATLRGS